MCTYYIRTLYVSNTKEHVHYSDFLVLTIHRQINATLTCALGYTENMRPAKQLSIIWYECCVSMSERAGQLCERDISLPSTKEQMRNAKYHRKLALAIKLAAWLATTPFRTDDRRPDGDVWVRVVPADHAHRTALLGRQAVGLRRARHQLVWGDLHAVLPLVQPHQRLGRDDAAYPLSLLFHLFDITNVSLVCRNISYIWYCS